MEGVVKEIEVLGVCVLFVYVDVSSRSDVVVMVVEVEVVFGYIDVVVNNVGILIVGMVEVFDEVYWDLVMDVNVKGIFLVV